MWSNFVMTSAITSDDPISGWAITYSGGKMDMNFMPEQIRIRDIAQGLSLSCRWGGQGNNFYSVAQHSVLLYDVMCTDYADQPMWGLWALLHDAAEAYIGDVPRPFKQYMPDFMQIEAMILQGVAEKFDMAPEIPFEVKRADHNIVRDEALVLFSHIENLSWLDDGGYLGVGVVVDPWSWQDARTAWLNAIKHSLRRCNLQEHWEAESEYFAATP
jgi:hypothetical protein